MAEAQAEFEFAPMNPTAHTNTAVAGFRLVGLPAIATLIAAMVVDGWPLLGVLVLSAGYAIHSHRAANKVARRFLRVADGELEVCTKPGAGALWNCSLTELEVALDTKEIQRVAEAGPVPELRFINAQVMPAADVSRILLWNTTTGQSMLLNEEHLPNTVALEHFALVRKFLRKNGWLPQDERETASTRAGVAASSPPSTQD